MYSLVRKLSSSNFNFIIYNIKFIGIFEQDASSSSPSSFTKDTIKSTRPLYNFRSPSILSIAVLPFHLSTFLLPIDLTSSTAASCLTSSILFRGILVHKSFPPFLEDEAIAFFKLDEERSAFKTKNQTVKKMVKCRRKKQGVP